MDVDGTGIRIDKFTRGAGSYFLSHLHSDHTSGLREGWSRGPLYCSDITAKLLQERFGIGNDVVTVLELGRTVTLRPDGEEVSVTAIEANHCPGAVMFHFEWPDRRVLYTGDFRLDDSIRREAAGLAGVDVAYVDHTYNDPKHVFPAQHESIDRVLELVAEHMEKEVFFALYSIGKTKILEAVREKFGLPVHVPEGMMALYRAMGYDHLVTRDASRTNLRGHPRWYFYKGFPWRHRRYRSTHAVIIPTGWTAGFRDDAYGYYHVPYSEHCDHRELSEFLDLLQPKETIPI